MLNVSLNELKQTTKMRRIKGYNNMSKEKLLSVLSESESGRSKKNLDNAKIKKIRKNLYEIENRKNISELKIKDIEKNLFELEESLSRHKKYYDYDDPEYKGIRNVGNLLNQSIDKDYYKLIKTINGFDHKNNYIEYESKGDKDKILLPEEYLNMIKLYLSDIINDHKTEGVWKVHSGNKVIDYKTTLGECKIQVTMSINFISSKDSDETCNMHTKSDSIEIMKSNEIDEIIEKLFKSLLQRCQEGFEESMKGSEFIFHSVNLLFYHLQKTSRNRIGLSYIDSPKWLENKKATINPKNNDNNCFQYTLTIALNYESIKKTPQIISKIKPFINQHN